MKKIIHQNILVLALWVLVLIPQLLLSQAAAIPDEVAYQKLEQQFEAPTVSSEQLFLFEKKGIQHLKDFMSLVEMLSADNMDPKFRGRFKMAAEKYFSTPTDSLVFNSIDKSNLVLVNSFLDKIGNGKLKFQEIKLSNFESTTPVFLENKYTWKVTFLFSQKENKDKNMIATLILNKGKKKFGRVEKEVWEVLLEKIKEEN